MNHYYGLDDGDLLVLCLGGIVLWTVIVCVALLRPGRLEPRESRRTDDSAAQRYRPRPSGRVLTVTTLEFPPSRPGATTKPRRGGR